MVCQKKNWKNFEVWKAKMRVSLLLLLLDSSAALALSLCCNCHCSTHPTQTDCTFPRSLSLSLSLSHQSQLWLLPPVSTFNNSTALSFVFFLPVSELRPFLAFVLPPLLASPPLLSLRAAQPLGIGCSLVFPPLFFFCSIWLCSNRVF